MKLLWKCPVQVLSTHGSSHYLICSQSEHKTIYNFYGEDKGKRVGDGVCVELLSVTTQGPVEPSRSFFGGIGRLLFVPALQSSNTHKLGVWASEVVVRT